MGTATRIEGLRRRNPLPEGTVAVGVGLALTAAGSYGYLVLSARALGPTEMGHLSQLWFLVFMIGGLFLPFEQEVSRRLVGHRVAGRGGRSVILRALALGGGLVGLAVVVIAVASPTLERELFGEEPLLVVGLVLGTAGYLVANLTEGVLSGNGRFRRYGTYLGGEATLRLGICVACLLAGVRTAGPIGLALGAAPLVMAVIVLAGQRSLAEPGPPEPWGDLAGGLGALLGASFLAQVLVNAAPLLLGVLAGPERAAEVGVFTAALVVARIPLFLFQAVQATLLPSLTGHAARGDLDLFRAGVRRLAVVVGALVVVGAVAAFMIGPAVITRVFGPDYPVQARTVGLLAVASGGFIMANALALACIALGGSRRVVFGWLIGVVVMFTTVSFGDDPMLRVELAFAAATLTATVAMAVILRGLLRRGAVLEQGPLLDALNDIAYEP